MTAVNSGPVAPDGGFWGWMSVIGCFMGNFIGDGVMYSFGVIIPNLKEHFGIGSAEVSTVYSIQMGVTFGSGPVASFLTNRFGWRWTTFIGTVLLSGGLALSTVVPNIYFLYLTAGIIAGLGLGIIYLPRLDCITQYFDKKRPFVTGISICGSGLGTFVFSPMTQVLMDNFGWQNALLIVSSISATNIFYGLMFAPLVSQNNESENMDTIGEEGEKLNKKGDQLEEGQEDAKQARSNNKETLSVMIKLLTNPIFMIFAVSNFLTSLGYPIPYTFVPDNAKTLGMTAEEGSYIVALIGISNTIARVILGIISQKLNRLFLYNTCLVICGMAMCMSNYFQPMAAAMAMVDCPAINSTTIEVLANGTEIAYTVTGDDLSWACSQYMGQVVYAVIYGITSAAYVLLTTLVLADLLGADMFTNSFGLLLLFQGVATLIGPPVVGLMFDEFGNYDSGFILMGIMISLSGLMLYPVPCLQDYVNRQEEKTKLRELNGGEPTGVPA